MNAMTKLRGNPLRQSEPRQAGASLLIALIMLMLVMLLAATVARMALINEKSARNDRDRHIAFEAAEAALRDAELRLPELAAHRTEPDSSAQAAPPWFDYGHFSGRHFPHGAASLPHRLPRYQIEFLYVHKPALDAQVQVRYRINAIGFGSRAGTQVRLQTIHAIRDGQPPLRLSWRELHN